MFINTSYEYLEKTDIFLLLEKCILLEIGKKEGYITFKSEKNLEIEIENH